MPQISSTTTLILNGVTTVTVGGTLLTWNHDRWLGHADFWATNTSRLNIVFAGDNSMIGSFQTGGTLGVTFNEHATGSGRQINALMLLGSGINNVAFNSGRVGALATGSNNDTVTFSGISYAAFINTGDGADTVNVSTTAGVGVINLGQGNNRAVIGATGSAQAIIAYDGADVVVANGSVGHINTGGGNDIIHINGDTYVQNILAGAGNDLVRLNVTGSIGSVDLGDGNNNLTMLANTGGFSSLQAYGGNDVLLMYGGFSGMASLGHGNNIVQLFGDSVAEFIVTGSGSDTVQILGHSRLGTLSTGDGADIVVFNSTGSIGNINLGNGNNILRVLNPASYVDTILSGADNDFIQAYAEVNYISTGGGNDRVETSTEWTGFIDTGRGNDTVSVGSGGVSVIRLGRDADTVILTAPSDQSQVTTIFGGSGVSGPDDVDFDTVSMAPFTSDLWIDLDLGRIESVDGYKFNIFEFEAAIGGSGHDMLFGTSRDNLLMGGAGNDTVIGYGGNDTLDGGAGDDSLDATYSSGATLLGGTGNDTICDGIGADLIDGGTGDDRIFLVGGADTITGGAGADMFTFWNMDGENTPLITDFSRAQGDSISFEGWNFIFIGSDAFSNDYNELRYEVDGSVTRLLADWDADGVADFRIEFTGGIDFIESDFLL